MERFPALRALTGFILALITACCLQQGTLAAGEELAIPIEGEDAQTVAIQDGHMRVPAGMITYTNVTNPGRAIPIKLTNTQDILGLMKLITEAEAKGMSSEENEALPDDGSCIVIHMTPNGGEPHYLYIGGLLDQPSVAASLSKEGDGDIYTYVTLTSEALTQRVSELTQWRSYPLEALKPTRSIAIDILEYPESYQPIATIEDQEVVNGLVEAIIAARVIPDGDSNLPPQVRLSFNLEDGTVLYAFTRREPVARLMQAGGRQLELANGALAPVSDLVPPMEQPED